RDRGPVNSPSLRRTSIDLVQILARFTFSSGRRPLSSAPPEKVGAEQQYASSTSWAKLLGRSLFMDAPHIRNFSIIAHIDHGKTTLSDRLLHRTGTIATRDMEAQLLDSMDLERERGITIKAHPVTMTYAAKNGETYELHLIDTRGQVDFSYEVSRSLSACEGALLIIDAAQGVEAQTVANLHLAMKQNLTIIPVINKIDLPHANVELAKTQLEDILAIPAENQILASAKQGIVIEDIVER